MTSVWWGMSPGAPIRPRRARAGRAAAGVHGSGRGGGVRGAAVDGQRQARQTGAAGTGVLRTPIAIAPRPPLTEEILAGIYAQVLGLERVGVDDSFFDLGGDSLLAMRVIAAINTALDAGVSVRDFVRGAHGGPVGAPDRRGGGWAGAVGGRASGPAVVPLSFAQSRLWFLDQLQGPSPIYNMAVALRLCGRLDAEALGAALADVVGRHESPADAVRGARRSTAAAGCRRPSGPISVGSVVDATGWPESRLQEAIDEAAALSVSTWQLKFRCGQCFSASPRTSTCWWPRCTISPPTGCRCGRWCVIWARPMPAGARDRAPDWTPLPVQYVDYTLWQREQLGDLDDRDSRIAAQLAYWEDALAGLPERLQLPTDRPYPPVADYRGARVAVNWPAELQQRVARVAREHNATSFMVVQAALAVLLSKLSASSDVAVGFPIAGRA